MSERDWLVRKVETCNEGIAIHVTNLNFPPGHMDRNKVWAFGARWAFRDARYDATNAEITPAAADLLCKTGAFSPIRNS